MPCLEPVIMTDDGEEEVEWDVTRGSKVLRPLMTPKRLVDRMRWK